MILVTLVVQSDELGLAVYRLKVHFEKLIIISL